MDRYDALRKAIEAGPTPGPWSSEIRHDVVGNADLWVISSETLIAPSHYENDLFRQNADYIAAADPDTIRELLRERDALIAERGDPKASWCQCVKNADRARKAEAERDALRGLLGEVRDSLSMSAEIFRKLSLELARFEGASRFRVGSDKAISNFADSLQPVLARIDSTLTKKGGT